MSSVIVLTSLPATSDNDPIFMAAVAGGRPPVRLRLVGGGPEGTPGTPSSARAALVPEVSHPGVRSGPAGGAPDIPSDHRPYAANPPYGSPLRQGSGTSWQATGPPPQLGRGPSWVVTDGATARQTATPDGRRGCTGARPQDRSKHRGNQTNAPASPAPWGHLPAGGWGRAPVRPRRPPRQPQTPQRHQPKRTRTEST
ncbi:hypothetical protein Srufu_063130 [Streptomyces libani subsp. rufus]|nr:hypothetical protein Srufu_063130 [Streptomyces libani subsp. rufus]